MRLPRLSEGPASHGSGVLTHPRNCQHFGAVEFVSVAISLGVVSAVQIRRRRSAHVYAGVERAQAHTHTARKHEVPQDTNAARMHVQHMHTRSAARVHSHTRGTFSPLPLNPSGLKIYSID